MNSKKVGDPFVGDYWLGNRRVRLEVKPESRDGYLTTYDDENRAVISVGIAHEDWPRTVAVLMHEAMEFAMIDLNCRFDPSGAFSTTSDHYLFVMRHHDFSEAIARCADFCTAAIPAILPHWNKIHRKKR